MFETPVMVEVQVTSSPPAAMLEVLTVAIDNRLVFEMS